LSLVSHTTWCAVHCGAASAVASGCLDKQKPGAVPARASYNFSRLRFLALIA
jgi:hypothetical protein